MTLTPVELAETVARSVRDAVADGELGAGAARALPDRAPLRPAPPRAQDPDAPAARWATGIAMRLAGPAGRPADEVARVVRDRLLRRAGVRGVEVSGGGFLTISLAAGADAALLREILARRERLPAPLPEDPARDVERWRAAGGAAGPGGDAASLLVQREENPLFLVRYAHARSRGLARAAAELGFGPDPDADAGGDGARYAFPYAGERAVLRLLGEACGAPEKRATPARLRRLADALLAAERERSTLPRGDEKPGAVHRARLALAQAAGTVLADGLYQLGISAPDHL